MPELIIAPSATQLDVELRLCSTSKPISHIIYIYLTPIRAKERQIRADVLQLGA